MGGTLTLCVLRGRKRKANTSGPSLSMVLVKHFVCLLYKPLRLHFQRLKLCYILAQTAIEVYNTTPNCTLTC